MNRYKKELNLIGYTNLPTIKLLVDNKNKVIKQFDNFNIKNVKSAINSIIKHKQKYISIDFKFTYYDKNNNIYKTNTTNKKRSYNSIKEVYQYIKNVKYINNGISNLIVSFNNNNDPVYQPFNCKVSYNIKFYNTTCN